MSDQDVIQKLIQVEEHAQKLIDDAQKEADARVSAAKEEESRRFQEDFAHRSAELEAALKDEKNRLKEEKERKVAAYLEELKSRRIQKERFFSELKAILDKGII